MNKLRLPRKIKKASRSDYRQNTKWVRKSNKFIKRYLMQLGGYYAGYSMVRNTLDELILRKMFTHGGCIRSRESLCQSPFNQGEKVVVPERTKKIAKEILDPAKCDIIVTIDSKPLLAELADARKQLSQLCPRSDN